MTKAKRASVRMKLKETISETQNDAGFGEKSQGSLKRALPGRRSYRCGVKSQRNTWLQIARRRLRAFDLLICGGRSHRRSQEATAMEIPGRRLGCGLRHHRYGRVRAARMLDRHPVTVSNTCRTQRMPGGRHGERQRFHPTQYCKHQACRHEPVMCLRPHQLKIGRSRPAGL